MFLFRKQKTLGHKETALVGFVLAIMSLLVMAIVVYGFPLLSAWLYVNGVYSLDLFLLAFIMVVFLSLQGLILFGFPLFYAQDKKSHMTGFRILLYAIAWMIIVVGLISALAVAFSDYGNTYSIDDFDMSSLTDTTTDTTVEVE